MANTKKYVSLDKLSLYDEKIKAKIKADDDAVLASAKSYAEGLASNYDATGSAATAKSEAISEAKTYTDGQITALTTGTGAVKVNADAIAAIKDDANVDSFADVVAELAKKQNVGDYATKAEAQGYADAKNDAIADAKAAGEAAQATANANAQAIDAINHVDTGILAQAKGHTNTEVGKVQTAVDTLAGKVGTVPEGSTVMGIIANIQENAYNDSEIQGKIDAVSGKVDTLVGSDANKSVRAIAAEELAAQLVADGAAESLDTLGEIAAWIQSHPDDAAAMNEAIVALQNKVVLGTYVDGEETKEYATVKAYVEAAIAALNIGDYAKAADLATLAGRVGTLETASATYATKTEVQAVSDSLTEYKDAHAGDYTNSQIDAAIKVVADDVAQLNDTYATDAELNAAIEAAKTDASNKDAVVLAEAQKAATAVQTALDTHTGNGDIHVTAEDKAKWDAARAQAHAHSNYDVLQGITSAKVTAWDAAEGNAKSYADGLNTTMDGRVATLETWHNNFVECSQEDINNLFA